MQKKLALTLLSSIKVTIFLACQKEFLKDVFKVFFFWLSTRSLKAVIILLSACPYLITVIEAKLSAAVSTECTLTVFVISMKNIQSLILLERILSGFAECPILCASPIAIICQGTHTATDPITCGIGPCMLNQR